VINPFDDKEYTNWWFDGPSDNKYPYNYVDNPARPTIKIATSQIKTYRCPSGPDIDPNNNAFGQCSGFWWRGFVWFPGVLSATN
jgi:hypothetical protein